ncbi:helix-turn-helix transcriptional regulator [Actinosynnema sp. CS-041913]|uniref:helix-turn-helix transcriptional regulator n=1 Tax=Actinosynnema sp. CS-041913 TaxID=3239917 RepID=UPI003D9242FF
MGDDVEQAVIRVIESLRGRLGDQITIDDMARIATFSKFHFTRVFQRVTGVSPGRFLLAMRLEEAKRLLISTSLTVTEISHQVGYSSVGKFSSRFTDSVGMSPSAYRQLGGYLAEVPPDRPRPPGLRYATIRGRVSAPADGECGLVFVGLFRDRVPQGRPTTCAVLERPGPFVLENVPPGAWYVLAHSVAADRNEVIRSPSDAGLFVASHGSMTVHPGSCVSPVELRLQAKRTLDPPVLLALLDIRRLRTAAVSAGGFEPASPFPANACRHHRHPA